MASGKWLPSPGGHLEFADDSLPEAVLRELDEELGLATADLYWLLDDVPVYIDVYPIPARETKKEPGHLHLDFCYLMRTERTAFRLQQDEVRGTDWRPIQALQDLQLRAGVHQALLRPGTLR